MFLSSVTKKEEGICFVYLRLRRITAAATAMMITMTTPMATYVAVGVALPGGMITGLGVCAIVGVGWTGVGVGCEVGC